MQAEIEKTTAAIAREEGKLRSIAYNGDSMPQEIRQLIENGTLKQWGKYPHIMFVDGVDKARIIWDDKKKQVMHKYTNKLTDKEQWKKFAQVYNYIAEAVNKRKKYPASRHNGKKMRTKTPKQLHEQWFRIKPRFNGNHTLHMKYVRIYHIYRANMEKYCAEWTMPVPASVYAKQV